LQRNAVIIVDIILGRSTECRGQKRDKTMQTIPCKCRQGSHIHLSCYVAASTFVWRETQDIADCELALLLFLFLYRTDSTETMETTDGFRLPKGNTLLLKCLDY
jgi:hypothetical protein